MDYEFIKQYRQLIPELENVPEPGAFVSGKSLGGNATGKATSNASDMIMRQFYENEARKNQLTQNEVEAVKGADYLDGLVKAIIPFALGNSAASAFNNAAGRAGSSAAGYLPRVVDGKLDANDYVRSIARLLTAPGFSTVLDMIKKK